MVFYPGCGMEAIQGSYLPYAPIQMFVGTDDAEVSSKRCVTWEKRVQAAGGSMVMLAKGNRSSQVSAACATYGGFYLGSIGGPAARLAQDCIKSVEVLEYPELGMEAVWKIEVEDFPAFIIVDDKGNDFYADTVKPVAMTITKRPGL